MSDLTRIKHNEMVWSAKTRKSHPNNQKPKKSQEGSHRMRQTKAKNRSPKTWATARRNRSKAKTWLLKDRGNARRSHTRSRGKTRKPGAKTKAEIPQAKFFPLSHKCTTSFSKIKQVPPLFHHFSQNSPPCWHMHTSSLKKPKAPPKAETPPWTDAMQWMQCRRCKWKHSGIQGYEQHLVTSMCASINKTCI